MNKTFSFLSSTNALPRMDQIFMKTLKTRKMSKNRQIKWLIGQRSLLDNRTLPSTQEPLIYENKSGMF